MSQLGIENLNKRNKQLENENEVLRDRILGFVLNKST